MLKNIYNLLILAFLSSFLFFLGCKSEDGSHNPKNTGPKKEEVKKGAESQEIQKHPEKLESPQKADNNAPQKISDKNYALSDDIYESESFKSTPNLVQKPVSYAPIADLLSKIEHDESLKLKSRGEAHITIITPPEFQALKSHLSLAQIEKAFKKDIEKSKFEVKCLGRGEKIINGKNEQVFYIVVSSPEIFNIRENIHALFVKKGGKSADFDPKAFYPHITVGFTERDLHPSDGVTKDVSSCIATLML